MVGYYGWWDYFNSGIGNYLDNGGCFIAATVDGGWFHQDFDLIWRISNWINYELVNELVDEGSGVEEWYSTFVVDRSIKVFVNS